ncbi:MAG: L-threonylcarbamoyladenylate synthase [Pirellulales bacterium]
MARPLPDTLKIQWPQAAARPPADTEAALDRAADILRAGGLVAIPTETVYGLAGDALDPDAVAGIFRAKGRPATNPLIVHVSDVQMARRLAASWPESAEAIAARLWPGPVTVVVPRGPSISDIVTAGGPTVAVRCPDHRLARRLIEKVGRPLAAPSANRSEAVSPTTAAHVLASLGSRVDLILDGGPCGHGIESTVVDCTADPPRILRPGPMSRMHLEEVVGGPVVWPEGIVADASETPLRAPGLHAKHYAPRTPLDMPTDPTGHVAALLDSGKRVGWMTRAADGMHVRRLAGARELVIVPMPDAPADYARLLYATLHALDQRGLARIVVDPLPDGEEWRAVRDRLVRAVTRPPPGSPAARM